MAASAQSFTKNLAKAVVLSYKDSFWTKPLGFKDLKTFANDLIKIVDVINTTVKSNDWLAYDVKVIVVEDRHQSKIGQDLFSYIGLSVNQSRQVPNFNQIQCHIKRQIALEFSGLISRIGKSRKHTVKSTFYKNAHPTHQKGPRLAFNFQPLVKAELKKFNRGKIYYKTQ